MPMDRYEPLMPRGYLGGRGMREVLRVFALRAPSIKNLTFSPTRLAFGVLTFQIENRMGLHAVSGSPDYTPWFPRWSELGSPGG